MSSTRRGFLLGATAGLAGGAALGWFGRQEYPAWEASRSFTGHSVEVPRPTFALPGPFPGRVVEVRHAGAVTNDNHICADVVTGMMQRGMCELTGAEHAVEAWRRFFEPGDVVGIKVNPVGYSRQRALVGAQECGRQGA
jgi:hypothetical protein